MSHERAVAPPGRAKVGKSQKADEYTCVFYAVKGVYADQGDIT